MLSFVVCCCVLLLMSSCSSCSLSFVVSFCRRVVVGVFVLGELGIRVVVWLCVFGYVSLTLCRAGCLSVCRTVGLSVCLWVGLSVGRSVCLSVCLSVCRSDCLSVCLTVCQSVCLFGYFRTHENSLALHKPPPLVLTPINISKPPRPYSNSYAVHSLKKKTQIES